MKTSLAFAILSITSASLALAGPAKGKRMLTVLDDHPFVGGGTNKSRNFLEGDPRFQVEPPGKCDVTFLGGTFMGHPDPRIKNPKAVCGHGRVLPLADEQRPPAPLTIEPITAPVPPDEESTTLITIADSSRIVREQLPQLDKPEGDQQPKVIEIRRAIRAHDVSKALKNAPKPAAQK